MLNIAEITDNLSTSEVGRARKIGDILQYALPWLALLIIALRGQQLEAWRWLYIGLTTAIITQLLKYLFDFTDLGRRPDGGNGAMPSGHTSSAFMGAWFILFQNGILAAIVPILLAGFTGYSRIVSKRHWLRDVIGGALLALLINYLFFFRIDVSIP